MPIPPPPPPPPLLLPVHPVALHHHCWCYHCHQVMKMLCYWPFGSYLPFLTSVPSSSHDHNTSFVIWVWHSPAPQSFDPTQPLTMPTSSNVPSSRHWEASSEQLLSEFYLDSLPPPSIQLAQPPTWLSSHSNSHSSFVLVLGWNWCLSLTWGHPLPTAVNTASWQAMVQPTKALYDEVALMSLVLWHDSIPFYFCIFSISVLMLTYYDAWYRCDASHEPTQSRVLNAQFLLSFYCLWRLYLVMPRRWTNDH